MTRPRSASRIAVVGAGLAGRQHIAMAARFAHLDAVIDPDPDAAKVAESHGVRWYEDLADYLGVQSPDGIIIATPNHLHLEHGVFCIGAGIPVLVEKPLADNSTSARRLVDHAAECKVPLLVGHHRRYSPLIMAAKRAIEAGDLGRIVTVAAQFWLYKPDDYFDVAWRRKEGAGPTFINLIHDIDLLRHLCGDIVSVQARESRSVRGFDVEDSSALILEFKGSVLGTVSISDTVVAPWSWELTAGENTVYPKTQMSCYMIGGTRGSLSLPDLRLWTYAGKRSWWESIDTVQLPFQAADPIESQFRHFLDVVENGATPVVSGIEGWRNLLVLDAIKDAARHHASETVGN